MPVSWQIGPTSSMAMSTLDKIMSSACEDWMPGVSLPAAIAIAARTSGGRFVDVGGKICGRLGDKFQQAAGKEFHRYLQGGLTLSGLQRDQDFIKQTTTFSHQNGTRLSRPILVASGESAACTVLPKA